MKNLRIGDKIKVIHIGGEEKYFNITAIDDIFYRDAHSALAAAGTETFAEVSKLDPPTGQIYNIYSVETECNVKLQIKQPAATNRFGTNLSPDGGYIIDATGSIMGAREIDMWIAEDYPPNVQITNSTGVSITPILWWIGKRYGVREISKPAVFTIIKIGGLSD